jgi:predicted transcriptional regulator
MIDRLETEVNMLQRQLEVLRVVIKHQPIGIVRIADRLNSPQHKARYSLRVLEEEGLIEPTKRGAVTTEEANDFLEELDDEIGTFLQQLENLQGLKEIENEV